MSVKDLGALYPAQFDTVEKFQEPAKILKPYAEPYIDHPRKYKINLKIKIEAELKKMERNGCQTQDQGAH